MPKHTLWLPFDKPPFTLNNTPHWAVKKDLVFMIRRAAKLLAMKDKVPRHLNHITVSLNYVPRDNRIRDEDNLTPILKAACDGLVDALVVPEDTNKEMTKLMPIIHPKQKEAPGPNGSRFYLTIDY